MYCMNCGAVLPAESRFCAQCGARADAEATRIAARSQPDLQTSDSETNDLERVIFRVRPTLLFIGLGYAAAALGAVVLTILLAYAQLLSANISVLVALPILLIPAFYHLKRNTVSYTLTDSKIEIAEGILVRTTRNLPLRNIQNVTVTAGLLERLLGFGSVLIDDASEQAGATVLHNIPEPRRHAEFLLRELRRWR